jgi:hypothetical protein
MKAIYVTVEGGIVQSVEGIPSGTRVEVWDFDDCSDEACEQCEKNAAGESFHRSIYHGTSDPAAILADLVRWYDLEGDERELDDPIWERARRAVAS